MSAKPAQNMKFKVLVVDDHPVVRQGVATLINHSREFRVCGQAATADQAWNALETQRPHLLLLDLMLGGVLATDLIRKAKRFDPQLGIVVFSMHDEALYAHQSIHAGATGYVLKEEPPRQILQALRRTVEGKKYLSAPLVKKMIYYYSDNAKEGESRLSRRELQIFHLMGEGLNTRGIARDLSLGVKTVETYCARIKKKLDARDLREVMREAFRWKAGM